MVNVSEHYDLLIENGNDPVTDCKALQKYMDKWDGELFVTELNLDKEKDILEIGCGTGRILKKLGGNYKSYLGVDISQKTVLKAKEHFVDFKNAEFICADFNEYTLNKTFDTIYSTLTFMHLKDKDYAIKKVYELLSIGGKFVVSIDKNQNTQIDTGYSTVEIFPDDPDNIKTLLRKVGFKQINCLETELAYILSAIK